MKIFDEIDFEKLRFISGTSGFPFWLFPKQEYSGHVWQNNIHNSYIILCIYIYRHKTTQIIRKANKTT